MNVETSLSLSDMTFQVALKKELSQSLSERLRLALGPEEEHPRFLDNTEELTSVIGAYENALKDEASKSKLFLDICEANIVDCLFYRPYHEAPNLKLSRAYKRATIVCILQFLAWCRNQLERGRLEWRWLFDFDFDIFESHILGDNYKNGFCWRARTNNTFIQYADVLGLLTGEFSPQPLTRDMFALFGVRQLLEAKFRRIIGLKWIEPMPKIPHNIIPDILKKHEKEFKFRSATEFSFSDIMKVYDWTESSIHTMSSNYVWLVWKAVTFVAPLFSASQHGPVKYFHINGAVEMTEETFGRLREDFIVWVSSNVCNHGQERKIYWGDPETPIVNDKGELVRIQDSEKIVKGKD